MDIEAAARNLIEQYGPRAMQRCIDDMQDAVRAGLDGSALDRLHRITRLVGQHFAAKRA